MIFDQLEIDATGNDDNIIRNGNGNSNGNGNGNSHNKKQPTHRRTRSWDQRMTGAMRWRREKPSSEQQNNNVTQSGTQVFLPRMILRNMPYCQSNNQCQVINNFNTGARNKNKGGCYSSSSSSSFGLYRLLLSDWFHVLLRIQMHYSILMLLAAWLGMIMVFALAYMEIDTIYDNLDCGLGEPPVHITFAAAFAFSLETCTTVGYGLPGNSNAFFENNCGGVQTVIFVQMTWSMLFNAFLFAFFYSQLSKSESRSMQLVFSDKLCINVTHQNVVATVQCYDIDSAFPVVEAHARMYLLDHKLQMNPLRLTNPDDVRGGMLYPSLPQKVTHHIDHHSALAPTRADLMPLLACSKSRSTIPLRSCDSVTGDRPEVTCPVCACSFNTYERLATHVKYAKMAEKKENYPVKGSHLGFEMPDTSRPLTLQEVTDHIERTMSEIVVVVEGIDPQLSGTFQAIQSYKYEDLVFGVDHERCTSVTPDNKIVVDMKKFHRVRCNKIANKNGVKSCTTNTNDGDDKSEKLKRKDQSLLPSPFSSETDGNYDPLAIRYNLGPFLGTNDEPVAGQVLPSDQRLPPQLTSTTTKTKTTKTSVSASPPQRLFGSFGNRRVDREDQERHKVVKIDQQLQTNEEDGLILARIDTHTTPGTNANNNNNINEGGVADEINIDV